MRVVPILALAAGCAGSSFSKDDSGAVAGQLTGLSYASLAAAQPHPTLGAPPHVATVDQTVHCMAGGTAGLTGDFTGNLDASGTGTYSIAVMSTFTDCALGNGLVINGAPYLSTTGTLSFSQGTLTTGSVMYTGAFTAGGETCNVDFTIALAAAGPAPRALGSICGNVLDIRQH